MAGAMRAYALQLYGFVVKTYTVRWRTPVATAMEVLLPFIFMLLLSVSYWTTPSTLVPMELFDGVHSNPTPFNNSLFSTYYFCTHPDSSYKLPWRPCMPNQPLRCLSVVGGGKDLCMSEASYKTMSGLTIPMRYESGTMIIDSLDGYLAISAFFTETTHEENPTFFGRTIRASLSHFGKLLVASENASLASQFMSYCRAMSGMCNVIMHPSAFASHDDAVEYATQNENTVWAIVYLPPNALDMSQHETEFTISMNYSSTPATFTNTVKSFFKHELDQGASSPDYTLYHGSGFSALQLFVRGFYLAQFGAVLPEKGPSSMKRLPMFINTYGVRAMPMPIPEHYDNAFLTRWTYYLPLIAVIAALFPVARLTGLIVEEKAQGIREAMMIMGMHRTCHFIGWYATALFIDFVAAVLATMVMKIGFLGNTEYGVLLGVYFSFLQQNSAMCFLISTIFSNPRIAAWCAALTVFLFAMPFYSFPEGMSTSARLACALFPGVGYAEAFELMTNFARYNAKFTYATARSGDYCVNNIVGVMWASFVLMGVLGLYLDRVAPGAVGVPEHPLFFLATPWHWLRRCCCRPGGRGGDDESGDGAQRRLIAMSDDVYGTETGQSPAHGARTTTTSSSLSHRKHDGSEHEPTNVDDNNAVATTREGQWLASRMQRVRARAQQRRQFIEHYEDEVDPSDPSIAAVVHRLRKVYIGGGVVGFFYTFFTGLLRRGDRVAALDGVTFAMRTGEVSVLLGPNGAGKTTMISALCGMLTTTSGDVYIRGHRIATHLDECRRDVGFCPQRNIVWSELTVEEHVTFYARLKAARITDIREAVRSTIELVNLTDKRNYRAAQLSGGQRRRLCLAMALVGDPAVLLLDEPTAGMDMKGRQMMYEVLRRARARRSVLLSTHLLDEADRVGDRVLLLQRGRLVAEGSSMFLKSRMRVGYVVTCVLQSGLDANTEDAAVNALIAYVHDKGYSGHRTLDEGAPQALPPRCSMLGIERRGREVSFRFDMSLLTSSGRQLLAGLEADREQLHLRTVGLNLATLTDVFSTVTEGRLPPATAHGDDGGNGHSYTDDMQKAHSTDVQQQQQQQQQQRRELQQHNGNPLNAVQHDRGNEDDDGDNTHYYYYSRTSAAQGGEVGDAGEPATHAAAPRCPYTGSSEYATLPPATATTKLVTGEAVMAEAATKTDAVGGQVYEGELLYEARSGGLGAYARQFRALFIKRMHFARRDVKLLVFQIALPVIFLLLSMLVNLTRAPTQPSVRLDMTMYDDYATNPAEAHVYVARNFANPLVLNAAVPSKALGSHIHINITQGIAATPYQGKPLPDAGVQISSLYAATLSNHTMPHYFGLVPTGMFMVAGPPHMGATVLHNISHAHAIPQGIDALFNLVAYQVYGDTAPRVITRNSPLHFGEYERQLFETSKPILMGMFLVLPFVLIPSQTISYIVRENECGARHMQWLSGVSVLAYWFSCFLFDALCYVGTVVLTFCLFAIFGRNEFISDEAFGPSVVLFLLFGFSSIPLSYMLSFFFKSPFAAQTTVLVVNFAFGFLWVTLESMLSPHAFNFTRIVTFILRVFPAVCFGEGVYILSGNALGHMLAPVPFKTNLWAFVKFQPNGRFVGGVGTALVYMGSVLVASTLLLVLFEYLRVQNASRYLNFCCACGSSSSRSRNADNDDDDDEEGRRRNHAKQTDEVAEAKRRFNEVSVREEEERVCAAGAGGPASDLIALQRLSKQYWATRTPALDAVSLGVRRGEIVSLLGLNGAGKSTALGILAGETAATGGEAYVNRVSVERPSGRVFVGYCPQYDPLLDRLTPREHLWLYARLRGVREACIAHEVDMLLRDIGLFPHRHQPACALSGGNKRRLSLAIALVGRTTSVLLDEPTAGMDAHARAQMCAIVRQLSRTKSVLLTTHLIDEVDALADRVAFLSRGRLHCIGTPQELKNRGSIRKTAQTGEDDAAVHDAACYHIHILFPRDVHLLDLHYSDTVEGSQYINALCRHVEKVMQHATDDTRSDNNHNSEHEHEQRREAGDEGQDKAARMTHDNVCIVSDVRTSSLTLQVRGRLTNVCTLVADLQQNAVPGVPSVSYVGVAQPGLEEVLLED